MSSVTTSDSESGSRRRGSRPRNSSPPLRGYRTTRKKKKLPPQETINKIWQRFSATEFSKATVILPFATSPLQAFANSCQPQAAGGNNLLVSEDFERAVAECRERVKKLIQECRRVNMRYRDPDFDIDWDLKWERAYCLNGLSNTKFNINFRAMSNPASNSPKAVKRVHEIFDKATFLKETVSPADIRQGSLGDCWLMSSLTALANMDVGLQRICVEYDTKIGIYGFVFHRDGEWIISIIDDKLYLKSPDWDSPSVQRRLLEQTDREDVEKEYREMYQTGSQALFFAHCRDPNETWLPLLEKAYAKAHGDYSALIGGWIGEGLEDLTGGVTTELLTSDILDTDEFWSNEIMKVNIEFLFGCTTGLLDGGYGSRGGISEGHAYVIMEARELSTGERLVKLRNPWGKGKKGNWKGAWSDGSKEFTPDAQQELNHKFGNDSVFWISYQDLLRKYQHFDRTRLFMDSPEWRISQKWISMEVPWRAEFEQKFRIVLKKESPIVLVLSQLDDRYFEGLQGQYRFRLQFRLHEVDSPGEQDYIVRSHGNYLMKRSVVTELKSLRAGTYSVFVMVVAVRNSTVPSVEDVVMAQCRRKSHNNKLAQVGMSYDLAHSKGAVYMESKAAAKKAADKANAQASRIATRRKNWEKRHLSRDIFRKQEKKNREKRESKGAEAAAEVKEKKEKATREKGVQSEDVQELRLKKKDKGMQTGADSEETVILASLAQKETAEAVKTDDASSSFTDSQDTPAETLKSSVISSSPRPRLYRVPSDGVSASPYPHIRGRVGSGSRQSRSRGPPQRDQMYTTYDGASSASPVSDIDDIYSDDDLQKPGPVNDRSGASPGTDPGGRDSDDDDEVEPWNAVCIVGFRVYSQDEGLELKIFEDGMEAEEEEKLELELKNVDKGSEGDVEDAREDLKTKKSLEKQVKDETGQQPNNAKTPNSGKVKLPIRSKEDMAILINDKKEASSVRSLPVSPESQKRKAQRIKQFWTQVRKSQL